MVDGVKMLCGLCPLCGLCSHIPKAQKREGMATGSYRNLGGRAGAREEFPERGFLGRTMARELREV